MHTAGEFDVVRALAVAVSVMPALTHSVAQPSAQSESVAPTTVALVESWPDGRTIYELTSTRRASMWTPFFPRVDGYKLPEGATPVYAVQFGRVLVGRNIHVDISVLLGSAQPPGVPIASVVVSPGSRVVIDALAKFGVQPVTLSMVDVAPMTPYLPTVVSVSPQIEVANVDLLNAPYPGYRMTLRNLGSKGVSNVHVQSYRGQEKALSALKRAEDGRPMMHPGGSYTFDMNLTSGLANELTAPGRWTPRAIDLIEFDSVRWDDGTYDGTPPFPDADALIESDSGRRLQLRRIVDALRAAFAEPSSGFGVLASAKNRIDVLTDAEPDQVDAAKLAMQSTKASVRADIARFERDHSMSSDGVVRDWLTSLLRRYEAWLTRLSPP
ncbi:MAG: hypothetical protein DMF94_08900 [Acidobacteria bacterium]|nr:MAG: hypothetical protein DMF94_08900 [Acidobacteriota bacterium]